MHEHHEHEHHEHVPVEYTDAVEGFRLDKDDFFKTNAAQPDPRGRARRPSPACRTTRSTRRSGSRTVRLEPYTGDEPSNFQIPTSDGQLRPAHRAGVLRFELDAAPRQLTAYTFDGGDGESLFVPFLDATSGTETYGAGRYLDLEPEDDGTYALDFNLAYHPSCVYDAKFSCPLTPAENRLRRIEAGERFPADVEA